MKEKDEEVLSSSEMDSLAESWMAQRMAQIVTFVASRQFVTLPHP